MDQGIMVTAQTILTAASVLSALVLLFGAVFAVYRWYLKQNKRNEDIRETKDELSLLTYGVLACLKGLAEQGCDGPVKTAIDKIEKHLNQQAHK